MGENPSFYGEDFSMRSVWKIIDIQAIAPMISNTIWYG